MTFQKSTFPKLSGIPYWLEDLERRAVQAAKQAYCPYSKFHVGASVLCENGNAFEGCNIENASYGLTVCAERTALFAAVASGHKPIALAVACPDLDGSAPDQYKMPCGACRQVMAEFLNDDALIVVVGVRHFLLSELLPKPFKL